MISEMVIVIVDENVEDHSPPQFARVFPRIGSEEPQLFCQTAIALLRRFALMRANDCQARNKWHTLGLPALLDPVKSFDEIDVLAKYFFETYRWNVEPSLGC